MIQTHDLTPPAFPIKTVENKQFINELADFFDLLARFDFQDNQKGSVVGIDSGAVAVRESIPATENNSSDPLLSGHQV